MTDRIGDYPQPDAALIKQVVERRNDAEFMDRLRRRIAQDGPLLERLAESHQCRFPGPNDQGFPVNQCLDCGGWVIAPPDVPFIKVDGFEPCVYCGKPTCYLLRGVRTHRSCAEPSGSSAQGVGE